MISKRARTAFFKRELRSFDWIKKCSRKELNTAFKELKPKPRTIFNGVRLWLHQRAVFLILVEWKRFLIFLDMGNGKTLLTLALIVYRKKCKEKPKVLVFVPYITAVETWVEEVEIYTPELKCVPLLGTKAQNLSKLKNEDGDLFVICYQSAVAMLSKKIIKKDAKNKWNFSAADTRKVFADFDMVVMDEIHKIKSVKSLTYRMCRSIAKKCDWAFGLTGTPFGKDLTDLWAQFYVIDQGESLGPTLGLFRECFFSSSRNYWGTEIYKFKKSLEPTLHKMIKNSSIRYAVTECHDMPEKKLVIKYIRLTDSIEAYYKKGVEKLKEALKSKANRFQESQSAYMQLRQLSSGFMTFQGDDSTKVQIKFDDNLKLEALLELIEGSPHDAKIVVFHDFIFSNKMICAMLKKHKIKHASVWGGAKDKIGEIRKFKREPDCKVLVINSKSGSSSQNLQMANYIIFFENPASVIDREQAERRCWRPGQKKRVIIYDLIVKNTYDQKMYESNLAGKDLLRSLLDGKEKL